MRLPFIIFFALAMIAAIIIGIIYEFATVNLKKKILKMIKGEK